MFDSKASDLTSAQDKCRRQLARAEEKRGIRGAQSRRKEKHQADKGKQLLRPREAGREKVDAEVGTLGSQADALRSLYSC